MARKQLNLPAASIIPSDLIMLKGLILSDPDAVVERRVVRVVKKRFVVQVTHCGEETAISGIVSERLRVMAIQQDVLVSREYTTIEEAQQDLRALAVEMEDTDDH